MSKQLFISLLIVTLLTGIGIGFYLTPEYVQMEQQESNKMELGPVDANIDRRYIDGMIAHHMSAIDMSRQAIANSSRNEVRELGHFIIATDEKDIQDLYLLKARLYKDNSKVKDYKQTNLGKFDDKFDLRFINAMLEHHREAIVLAKDIRTKSIRNEILNIADTVITALENNSQTLRQWRAGWYGID